MHEMKTKQQRMGEAIGEEEERIGEEPTHQNKDRERKKEEEPNPMKCGKTQIKQELPTTIEQEKERREKERKGEEETWLSLMLLHAIDQVK
jgi:hypothetical protein